jgi:hypothetical protein
MQKRKVQVRDSRPGRREVTIGDSTKHESARGRAAALGGV